MPPSTSEAPAATVQCLVRPGRFSSVIIGSFQCVPPPTHARRPSRLWLNNFDPLMAGDCWPLEVMLNSTHESILSFIHVWCDRSFMNRAAKTCLLALHVLAGRPDFTYIHWTYEIDSRNPTFWNIWPRIILYLTGLTADVLWGDHMHGIQLYGIRLTHYYALQWWKSQKYVSQVFFAWSKMQLQYKTSFYIN